MKKGISYMLLFIWYYFLFYFLANQLTPTRTLNTVLTIPFMLITFELTKRVFIYKKGPNNEKFINEWKIKHKKGQFNFILTNGIKIASAIIIMIIIYGVTNKVIIDIGNFAFAFLTSIGSGFLLSIVTWSENNKIYINLTEKN
jgi:hypothetical protein